MVKKEKDKSEGLVFVGFFFIGLAFGFMFNHLVVGALLGLGCGFLAMFVAHEMIEKK